MLQETLTRITELQNIYSKSKTNTKIKKEISKELINILSSLMHEDNLSKHQRRIIKRCYILLSIDLEHSEVHGSEKIRLREVFTNLQKILSNWKRVKTYHSLVWVVGFYFYRFLLIDFLFSILIQ